MLTAQCIFCGIFVVVRSKLCHLAVPCPSVHLFLPETTQEP